MVINSPSLRRAALACTLSVFASSASFAQIPAGPAKPTVYNNPQVPDDPRVGLKGGITDAGVAALGMELVVNLPKPPGFAAGTTPQDAAPPPTPRSVSGRSLRAVSGYPRGTCCRRTRTPSITSGANGGSP